MEQDSHYYVIYLMCLTAGLEAEEAYEIAYSSQYVDDATDGREKIVLDENKNKYRFDPLRTSHNGFESIGVDVQQKIYYPFHFLPGLDGETFEQKMVTCPGKKGLLFNKVIDETLKSKNHYRVGISLHALADTYSHADFSGLWSWSNDANRVNYIPAGKNWFSNLFGKCRWHFRRALFAASPPIGHSNAFTFPDFPYLTWKYVDYNGKFVPVSNNTKFANGFLDLYEDLIGKYAAQLKKSPRFIRGDKKIAHTRQNEELRQTLWNGVNYSGRLKKRCENWKKIIRDFVQEFNSEIDRKIEAAKAQAERDELLKQKIALPSYHLQYKKSDWENNVYKKIKKFFFFDSGKRKLKVSIDDFRNSRLYHFHEAARNHRAFVLELVKNPSLVGVRAVRGEVIIAHIAHDIIEKTRKKEILVSLS